MNIEKFRITLNSICILIVSIVAILAFFWSFPKVQKEEFYDTAQEYIKELQLGYQGTKSDLVDLTQRYIDSVAPTSGLRALVLVEKCELYNFPIVFALAQGEIESHFGTKGLAFRTNSVWNVGAYDNHSYEEISFKFKNPNDSVEPYLELLINNYLSDKIIEDLFVSFVDINGNRYASDKYYETKLKDKVNYINKHYRIDSLQHQLNYYKIRL